VVTLSGTFSGVDGAEQPGLAAFRRSDGASLDVPAVAAPPVLLPLPDEIWIDGASGVQRGDVRYFAVFDRATGEVDDLALDADQRPDGILVDGDVAHLWGAMQTVRGETRISFAAFDLASETLLPLSLPFTGGFTDVAVGPDHVFVGGFLLSDDRDPGRLGIVDATDGTWLDEPSVYGIVRALERAGDVVGGGGDLELVDGVDRGNLAWLDASTGEALDRSADLLGDVHPIGALGSEIIVHSETPASHSGLPLDGRLFAVDVATGSLRDWQPGLTSGTVAVIRGLDDVVLVGGTDLHIGDDVATLFALDADTADVLPWDHGVPCCAVQAIVELGSSLAVVGSRDVYILPTSGIGAQ